MIIKEMTATFGKLDKTTLKLGPGLNVLQAANEGGKSTWSAFLRAMLYGIPTSQRDKAGFLAEKNRYAPWSGAAMEGSMTLEWQGREIILRRKAKGANPFGNIQAVEAATGERIPELSVDKPGEILLGVEREVFERSAFVGQADLAVDGDPALEKRIAALLTSGQEEVSFSQVQRQLKDWRNRRQHNKTGLLPKLEGAMAEQTRLLARARQARLQEEEGCADLETLKAEKNLLEQEKAIHKAKAEGEKWTRFKDSCEEYLRVKSDYDGLAEQFQHLPPKEELLKAQQEVQELQTLAAAQRLKEEEAQRLKDLPPEPARVSTYTAGSIAAMVAAVVAACVVGILLAGVIYSNLDLFGSGAADLVDRPLDYETLRLLTTAICGGLGGGVGALILRHSKKRREARQDEENRRSWEKELEIRRQEAEALQSRREEQLRALLMFVHRFSPTVTNEFGASAAISRALQGEDLMVSAKARLESARKVVQMAKATLESEQPPLPVEGTARYSYQETVARLAVTIEELSRRERMVAAAQGELRTLGDMDAVEAQLEANREEYRHRQEELAALELAMAAMEQANSAMQAKFSPALNKRAAELMAELTGGRYEKLTLTRTFEAAAQQAGEILPHSVLSLSQGTADQLYLAVRLAVCDLALPEGSDPPLVLDDALIHFDDSRMALAMEHLLKRAEQQQILLFSCHSREREALVGREGVTLPQLPM